VCAPTRGQGARFGPKTRNRAFFARFRVRRVKRRCGVMLVGGEVARIRQWWWWGDAFANCEAEEGFGSKTRNQAFVARFQACRVKRPCGVMLVGGGCRLVRWWQQGGCAFTNARPGGVDCAKNPETEHLWLGFGRAVYNGSAGRWRGVVVIPRCGDLESVGGE